MDTEKSDVEIILARCATKEELNDVKLELREVRTEIQALKIDVNVLRQEMQTLRQEMQALRQEMLGALQALRADTERAMHALTWKIIGLVLTTNAATVASVYYIARHG